MTKATLQEYADDVLDENYRQPLKTVQEACAVNGWEFEDKPSCCNQKVELSDFLGSAYHAECKQCGKFIADVSGPSFGNGVVRLLDGERVNLETDTRWIAGTAPKATP